MAEFPVQEVRVKGEDLLFVMNQEFFREHPNHTSEFVIELLEKTGLKVQKGIMGELDATEHVKGNIAIMVEGKSFLEHLYDKKDTHGRDGPLQLLGETFVSREQLLKAEETLVMNQLEEVKLDKRITVGIAVWDKVKSTGKVVTGAGIIGAFGGMLAAEVMGVAGFFTGDFMPFAYSILTSAVGMGATAGGIALEEKADKHLDKLNAERKELEAPLEAKRKELREHFEGLRKEFGIG